MPRGDGTGPAGFGPLTGRGAGYCAGYPVPGYANPYPRGGRGFAQGWKRGLGRGWGRGFGRGMAWRWGFAPPAHWAPYYGPSPGQAGDPRLSPEAEIRALKEESKILKEELAEIEDRLKELEAGESEDD
ncbi:MAG TPA: DUF5320 domain-containing protein [Bacillota bacterium]|nr:DUF5320 domain-containing protein [Bacillota bacterium]